MVECVIHHKMHRRAGNLSGEKTNTEKFNTKRTKQGEGYSSPAPRAEVPVIIITAVLIAQLQPDYLIPDALEERHCQC